MKSKEVVRALAALAQESRLAIYRLLVKRGPQGYTPSELAAKLGLPAPTLSFHLKQLQHTGLLTARREGRFLFYSASIPHMNRLVGFLTDHCCSLADEGCTTDCGQPLIVPVPPRRKRA
jgi:DNA-binding transcriptional ArsR family regulator